MKKNINIFLLLITTALLISCSDSLEESQPTNSSTVVSFEQASTLKDIKIKQQSNDDSIFKTKLNKEIFANDMKNISPQRLEQIRMIIKDATIRQTKELFISKKLSVEELVLFYISRIIKYETYNTIIQINPNIIKIAKQKDAILQDNTQQEIDKIMFGIPVIVKDNIATKNMNTTVGAAIFKDLVINEDAPIVKNLKNQGAIILAKANLSELSNFVSTKGPNGYSAVGGHTQNAYGNFDVGGSSSGSASAIALGLASVAIGTETAGSLIYPSGQNSVFALKPTQHSVNSELIAPIFAQQDTAGAIARNVEDVAITHFAMQNKTYNNNHSNNIKTIGLITNKTYDADIRFFQTVAETLLANENIKTLPIVYKDDYLEYSTNFLTAGIKRDFNIFLQKIKNISNVKIDSLNELIDYYTTDKQVAIYGHDILDLTKTADDKLGSEKNFKEVREALKQYIENEFQKNNVDILIASGNLFSGSYSMAGLPAMTVPIGYRENGEPVGITIVAKNNEDMKLINLAHIISKHINNRKNLLEY